jgi:hypothetical protein
MSLLKYKPKLRAVTAPAFLLAALMVGITASWTPTTVQSAVADPAASPPVTAATSMTLKEAVQQAVLSNPEVLARCRESTSAWRTGQSAPASVAAPAVPTRFR